MQEQMPMLFKGIQQIEALDCEIHDFGHLAKN
jgi:hypothetical protein